MQKRIEKFLGSFFMRSSSIKSIVVGCQYYQIRQGIDTIELVLILLPSLVKTVDTFFDLHGCFHSIQRCFSLQKSCKSHFRLNHNLQDFWITTMICNEYFLPIQPPLPLKPLAIPLPPSSLHFSPLAVITLKMGQTLEANTPREQLWALDLKQDQPIDLSWAKT